MKIYEEKAISTLVSIARQVHVIIHIPLLCYSIHPESKMEKQHLQAGQS